MPPKIRGMMKNGTPSKDSTSRFTLMLSGEDALDDQLIGDQPPQGLPHERFFARGPSSRCPSAIARAIVFRSRSPSDHCLPAARLSTCYP